MASAIPRTINPESTQGGHIFHCALGPQPVLPKRVLTNARTVAHFAGTASRRTLREAFADALSRIQQVRIDLHGSAQDIFFNFTPVSKHEEDAFRTVMVVDQLPLNWEFSRQERGALEKQILEALTLISKVYPDLREALRTIIGAFVMARLDHYDGGSISNLIGVIWIAMPPSRPVVDFAELVVHEYVHQCLFLEDMVHGIFFDGEGRLGQDDAKVTSAILKVKRGYDKSFHSAMVALVLARFYRCVGLETKAQELLIPLSVTIPELQSKTQFLTGHGKAVLEELVACFRDDAERSEHCADRVCSCS